MTRHRTNRGLAAAAAVVAAATLSVTAPASAAPATARPPAASTGATSHLPPRLRARVLDQVASRPASSATPRAAGFRPVAGTPVRTDLPSRIAVGAPAVTMPFHTSVSGSTDGYPDPVGFVSLIVAGDYTSDLTIRLAPGQRSFAGSMRMSDRSFLAALGTGYWATGIGADQGEGGDDDIQSAVVPVTVKLRSLLAQHVTRTGSAVEVFAATRTYAGDGRYLPVAGRTVYVQRYTSAGWRTVRTLATDRRGHVDTRIDLPYRVDVRVVTRDDRSTFGAVTSGTIL